MRDKKKKDKEKAEDTNINVSAKIWYNMGNRREPNPKSNYIAGSHNDNDWSFAQNAGKRKGD